MNTCYKHFLLNSRNIIITCKTNSLKIHVITKNYALEKEEKKLDSTFLQEKNSKIW